MSTGGRKKLKHKTPPANFLKSISWQAGCCQVEFRVDYRGILACLDGCMNIAMEQTEEYVDGQLKNKYGDAFIRGNNALQRGLWQMELELERYHRRSYGIQRG